MATRKTGMRQCAEKISGYSRKFDGRKRTIDAAALQPRALTALFGRGFSKRLGWRFA